MKNPYTALFTAKITRYITVFMYKKITILVVLQRKIGR